MQNPIRPDDSFTRSAGRQLALYGGAAVAILVILMFTLDFIAGVLGARRVPMTPMPQMVAIFNGAGGGAAAVGGDGSHRSASCT